MAQQSLNRPVEFPYIIRAGNVPTFANSGLMDATGEEVHFVGQVYLQNPTGGAKTISAAGGGKIHWRTGTSATFADPASALNIGIQDVSTTTAPAQGDGIFDVSAQLVGGTDPLTASTYVETTMESGSKTLAHGQLVSIAFQLSARGGADAVVVSTLLNDEGVVGQGTTAVSLKTAGVFTGQVAQAPNVGIEFDDGTIGWLYATECVSDAAADPVGGYHLNSATADEYGNFVRLPFPATVYGIGFIANLVNTGADFEVLLYSDPLGTPTVIASKTVDATQTYSINVGRYSVIFDTPILLAKDTPYAITIRPTTANALTLRQIIYGDVKFNKMNGLGDNCYAIRRIDNAGAFSEYNSVVSKDRIFQLALLVQGVPNDDGLGAGSSGMTYVQS